MLITDLDLTDGDDQTTDLQIGIETLHFTAGYYGEIETDGAIKTLKVHVAGETRTTYLIQKDILNSYDWTTIERSFDAGHLHRQTNIHDDGLVQELDYTGGLSQRDHQDRWRQPPRLDKLYRQLRQRRPAHRAHDDL